MAVLKLDRARMAAAAHRGGATTNDAVLVAVAAALHQILLGRGEFVDSIVITVPVSGRRPGGGQGWAISLARCSSMSRPAAGCGPAAVWSRVRRGSRWRCVVARPRRPGRRPWRFAVGWSGFSHGLGAA